MTDFVDIPFSVDANSIADAAIVRLAAQWDGWAPDDASLEVQQIETIAPMAADLGSQISRMPAEVVQAIGTNLLGIPYGAGVAATTTVTLTTVDAAGYFVSAATSEIEIDGFAFSLADDVSIPNGSTVMAGVPVVCNVPGAAANGLTGAVVAPLSLPPFVVGISVDSATGNGADPEDAIAYTNRVSRDLRLRAKTIVTINDFVLEALDTDGISFAWAIGNTARAVTVAVAGVNALPVLTSIKDTLQATYTQYAQVNTVFTIEDATYTAISVTWRAKAVPGADKPALLDAVNAVLGQLLSPRAWGQATLSAPGQGPSPVIRPTVALYDVVVAIGEVQGVQSVEEVWIYGATTNFVADPGFDSDTTGSPPGGNYATSSTGVVTTGSTLTVDATQFHTGAKSLKTVTTSGASNQGWAVTLLAIATFKQGKVYTASVWLKGNAGGESVDLAFGNNAGTVVVANVTLTNAWAQYSVSWTPTADRAGSTSVFAVRSHSAAVLTWFADDLIVQGPNNQDVTMPGDVPLPLPGVFVGVVD